MQATKVRNPSRELTASLRVEIAAGAARRARAHDEQLGSGVEAHRQLMRGRKGARLRSRAAALAGFTVALTTRPVVTARFGRRVLQERARRPLRHKLPPWKGVAPQRG